MWRLSERTRAISPVVATVTAAFLIILGILVIANPGLVAWLVGLGLVLAGVAGLAVVLLPDGRVGS